MVFLIRRVHFLSEYRHQDIGSMINTSGETVRRAWLTMLQQGAVQKDAHRLTIVEPDALQKLVHG